MALRRRERLGRSPDLACPGDHQPLRSPGSSPRPRPCGMAGAGAGERRSARPWGSVSRPSFAVALYRAQRSVIRHRFRADSAHSMRRYSLFHGQWVSSFIVGRDVNRGAFAPRQAALRYQTHCRIHERKVGGLPSLRLSPHVSHRPSLPAAISRWRSVAARPSL